MAAEQAAYRHIEMPFGEFPPPDVVTGLVAQHMLIRDLMAEVLTGSGQQRQETFRSLVALLSVHETAEEEVVHPVARKLAEAEGAVVEDRLTEEHQAKQVLEELDGMGADDAQFEPKFAMLRNAVLDHAVAEQRYEFNRIRQRAGAAQRASMGELVSAAERTAPTHPHAGVESAKANLALGPVAAVMDRARDAIRAARCALKGVGRRWRSSLLHSENGTKTHEHVVDCVDMQCNCGCAPRKTLRR